MRKKDFCSLSILIPTYNYDCTPLVEALHAQFSNLPCPCEIVVGDDGSTDELVVSRLQDLEHRGLCHVYRLDENVGRAVIRNLLGGIARYDHLLFLDSDGVVVRDDFVKQYCKAARFHDVVCGGIIHSSEAPESSSSLRYRYEKRAERRFTPEKLNKAFRPPFRSFNFMISHEVFMKHSFDISFKGYGYEDVLFGKSLRDACHRIFYIDNPLQNVDIEPNAVFVEKTEAALQTLKEHEAELVDDVRLLHYVSLLERFHLLSLVRGFSKVFLKPIRKNLCSSHPWLWLFNIYKIMYYIRLAAFGF